MPLFAAAPHDRSRFKCDRKAPSERLIGGFVQKSKVQARRPRTPPVSSLTFPVLILSLVNQTAKSLTQQALKYWSTF